jgi:outer membrane protein assembly factor BamD
MRTSMYIFSICVLIAGCNQRKPERTYADHAKHLYSQGVEALEDSNYIDAIKHFTQVKNKFPYTQYAALAELRVGDTYFDQDKFVEAVDSYRMFTRRRPNHAEVPYAMWRVGESFNKQRPSEFFLFPPAYEKDRGATKDAVRAYRAFLTRFPTDTRVPAAKKRLLECRRSLADFELYVAQFYLHRQRELSARGRLETLHEGFRDVPSHWRTASVLLVRVYLTLAKPGEAGEVRLADGAARAAKVSQAIIDTFPKSDEAREVKRVLKILKSKG